MLVYNDQAKDYCNSRGISDETAERYGLGVLADKRLASKLQNRLCFPIRNEYGEVLAYQGRAFDNETKPKYWHQPFDKKRVLYGLSESIEMLRYSRDFCVLCEGNFDAVMWNQYGFPAVAPQGTAFTFEQAALLRCFTNTVVLNYDNDAAGIKQVAATTAILAEFSFNVYQCQLVSVKDVGEVWEVIQDEAEMQLFLNELTDAAQLVIGE